MRKFFCQRRDQPGNICGEECTYISAAVEYAVLGQEKLKRKPVAVKRDIWVNCPVHGKVVYEQYGHHVTNWKKMKARDRE